MSKLWPFLALALFFYAIWYALWAWRVNQSKHDRLYPDEKPTMFDVRRLIIKGDKDAAVELYSQIFHTTKSEAKKAVDDLEKSIIQKNSQP